jgi:hypothetical protein
MPMCLIPSTVKIWKLPVHLIWFACKDAVATLHVKGACKYCEYLCLGLDYGAWRQCLAIGKTKTTQANLKRPTEDERGKRGEKETNECDYHSRSTWPSGMFWVANAITNFGIGPVGDTSSRPVSARPFRCHGIALGGAAGFPLYTTEF